MRLIVTADLHYNHRVSRPLADDLIDQINDRRPDALLLVGDTASGDGPELEACLGRFRCDGPKLFIAGNHELWTHRGDSYRLFHEELPRRVRDAGWHWLEGDPVVLSSGWGVAGSIGWYDYSFALPALGIPRRFYENKVSPAAAERFDNFAVLLERTDDISPVGMGVAARWNDGRYVHLHRSDEAFLDERLESLAQDLERLDRNPAVRRVLVGVHHVPFESLMPPRPNPQNVSSRAFAGAFLGSPRLGSTIAASSKVQKVFCGHSHLPAGANIGSVHATNIGSGYRQKRFVELGD